MRKEALIAVLIGLTFGGLITYGVYTANRSVTSNVKNPSNPANITPSPTSIPNTLFNLNTPEDGDVFSTPSATFSGSIKPGYHLIISTPSDDLVVTPSEDGSFTQNVKLNSGDNPIHITALNFDGDKQEVQLHLVYSTAKIKAN